MHTNLISGYIGLFKQTKEARPFALGRVSRVVLFRNPMPFFRSLFIFGALVLPVAVHAQTPTFSDVPVTDSLYSAVEYLKGMGAMTGYEDGTFRPEAKVNRAEAVKIIVTPLVTDKELKVFTKSSYGDVQTNAWFFPYVEFARAKLGIIDGPPNTMNFKPSDPVQKAQLLKMFFLANDIDAKSLYNEIKLPFAKDNGDVNAWYYPNMRFALASSMTMATSAKQLNPAKDLTRGDIALLLYRYYMYRDGKRTQVLLDTTESEVAPILKLLEQKNADEAGFAAARALIAARGALTKAPEEVIVKGAVKTAEAFQTLVLAYRANTDKKYDDAIKLSGDAWHIAQKAKEFSSSLAAVSAQIQAVSKNIADSARAAKK